MIKKMMALDRPLILSNQEHPGIYEGIKRYKSKNDQTKHLIIHRQYLSQ